MGVKETTTSIERNDTIEEIYQLKQGGKTKTKGVWREKISNIERESKENREVQRKRSKGEIKNKGYPSYRIERKAWLEGYIYMQHKVGLEYI